MDHLALVKKIFKENFLRDISDAEAQEFVEKMITHTREDLSKVSGFTEAAFQRYIAGSLTMVFSPAAVHAEIRKVVEAVGLEELEGSSKYKRLAEMNNACCLCFMLKKFFDEDWMIKAQDAPDIILVKPSTREFNNKPLDAVMLEIMEIPERVKGELGDDIELGIANFIRDKKFNKRYEGIPHWNLITPVKSWLNTELNLLG